jgi:hypothetical protein
MIAATGEGRKKAGLKKSPAFCFGFKKNEKKNKKQAFISAK